jgi:peptide/nickel transport system substrate-binding protein
MRTPARAALLCLLAASACTRPGGGAAVRFNLAADPANLNPLFLHQDAASVEQQVARLAFEPFIDLDSAGMPKAALLAVIPTRGNGGLSTDGRTITYRLRPAVRWSDGAPVTSADVLYTLHAILDPHNPVRSHEGYDLIDRASAPDAHTVVFHLKRPWAPAVMTYFSYGFAPQFVLPAHVLRKQEPLAQASFNGAPSVGDGPYVFESWHRGESLRYVANAAYWRGRPASQAIEMHIIPDPSTNLSMLQSGQLDWNLVAPVQYAMLKGKANLGFIRVATSVVAGIAFNTAHVPLDDVRVRRAIAMSVDRDAISRKITLGVYPVTNMLQPQFSWAYDPNVHQPKYDQAGADALLDAAGWTRDSDGMRRRNGKPLALTYVQFPESATGVRVAAFVQAALRTRGIDVSVKSISNAQLFLPAARGGTLASGNFDLAYVPFTMGADPDDSSVLGCHAAANYMRWCSPAVDSLENAAIVATTQAARKQIYREVATIVAREVPILYLFNANYVYAHQARLHGFGPNAFLPTWNASAWSLR